jgi:hypothetical protein
MDGAAIAPARREELVQVRLHLVARLARHRRQPQQPSRETR